VPCNQTGSIIVLGNDSDANGNAINVTQIYGNTPNGTASIGSNNLINYVANFCSPGIDTFYYVLCDNGMPSLCDTGRVIVNTPACGCNFPPIANTDTITTACGILNSKNIISNDTDPNLGSVLTVTNLLNTSSIIGTLTQLGNTITYTPPTGYFGIQQFNYIVCDNATPSKCDTGLVYLIVTQCNQAPVALNDNASTICNTAVSSIVLNNDTDPDVANTLIVSILKNAKNGTATITNNIINYTPNSCYNGKDTVTYLLCDNGVPSLCDTGYLFIIVDTCNCLKPIANFTLSDSEICVGECINFFDLSTNNPNAWSWIFDGVVPNTSNLKNPTNICYNTAGGFNVTLTANNTFGASTPIQKTARVVVSPNAPAITVNVTDTIGKTLNLNATTTGASNYNWTPAIGLSDPLIANPTVTLTSNASYTCNYTIANGCSGVFIVNINAVPGPIKTNYIWVPNAFSPNGDGDNPEFKAIGVNVSDYELIIYNRWGNKVFATKDINQGWNGTLTGVDNVTQNYFYYLRATFIDGKTIIKRGDITVIY
jgi:gliding motility-associated-like protein